MDFDLRAISLVPSLPADARVVIGEIRGSVIEFREGIRLSVTLPDSTEQYDALTEPEKTLTALRGWARVFRYPENENEMIHVIAHAESDDGDLIFYRVDLRQLPKPRRGLRPAVQIVGSAVMTLEECETWLIELAHNWATRPQERERQLVLSRPCPLVLPRLRLAWLGPELIDNQPMSSRLAAIGRVSGAEIVPIIPRNFRDVAARLSGVMPLNAVIVCRHFAPHINEAAMPAGVSLIHFCDSSYRSDIEQQVRIWIEIVRSELEKQRTERTVNERALLLATMLRAMLSHAKIGQFKHCQKETVLKCVKARRLDVAAAESILDENSEAFQDTRNSETLFLWKEHHDGRQYFLNPRRVEHIKLITLTINDK